MGICLLVTSFKSFGEIVNFVGVDHNSVLKRMNC